MSPTNLLEVHPLLPKLRMFLTLFYEREFAMPLLMSFSDHEFQNMVTFLWPHGS